MASEYNKEELIFQELEEIIPIGENATKNQNLFSIQHPKLSMVRDDAAFEIVSNALTSPSQLNDEDDSAIKLSYRVMKYICDDLDEAEEMLKSKLGKDDDDLYMKYILNPSRAGLLAKKIFAAYKQLNKIYEENLFEIPKPHIPHLNKTLEAILLAFPTQVVGASCVGGGKGIDQSLGQMIQLHKHVKSDSSPLPTVAQIMALGCTGRKKETASLQQQQAAMMGGGALDKVLINQGHRRKFVHGLTQWGGFQHLVNLIAEDVTCADDVSEILLSTVEFISFPQQTVLSLMNASGGAGAGANGKGGKKEDDSSVGEEALLSKLASDEIMETLFACIHNNGKNVVSQSDMEAISSVILGLFELATGKARHQLPTPPTTALEQEDGSVECKAAEETKTISPGIDDNKMVKAGVTDKMHIAINAKMESLVRAMDIYMQGKGGSGDAVNGVDLGTDAESSAAVRHPGRYTIQKPFTSNRLNLLTLFTDLVSYESHCESKTDEGKYHCAVNALDSVIDLQLPPTAKDDEVMEGGILYNPWPGICDLLFDYPENNMYQVQFYRLIHALCMTNHEKTLKLVVQKCKFLSRAIKTCSGKAAPSSTRGVLLRCLNAMRLQSNSISPNSFLRHYLESHDGWKDFQDELRR